MPHLSFGRPPVARVVTAEDFGMAFAFVELNIMRFESIDTLVE